MHESWVILAIHMTYNRLQNYTDMVVGELGIQTFEVMNVMLLFFVPTSAHPLSFSDKWFVQTRLNAKLTHIGNARYEK